ncbi:MAG: hypothetical protein HFE47_07375 [Clostridia bacterium]|nr:hypothetical protein [Clostridia bacterium]
MKRKKEYSMTAKERKALRKSEDEKKHPVREAPATLPESGEEVANGEVTVAAPASKKNLWVLIAGIAVALVLLLTAILLWVLPRSNSRYPRAVITLSDGSTLTMTIWEDDAPIAATNFIFLAQIGFFDDTLIYNVQEERKYMQFGAYKGYGKGETRYEDETFIAGIPQKMFNIVNLSSDSYKNNAQSNKFGYRLRKDTTSDAGRYSESYVVSFNNKNAADFVINLGENNTNFTNTSGQNNLSGNLAAIGKFEDEESQKVLDRILAMQKNSDPGLEGVTGTDPQIRIKSVKVSNLNKKKWKNFEFISYMNTANNGSSAWLSWTK